MATTNYSWNLPTVGGSENTWGTQLNDNWEALDTLLNGVTQAEISLLKGATSLVPSGVIMMWSGSIATIPSGFLLCDGTNGTPDLRSRFIVGAGSGYNPGDTGGVDSVTLTTNQIPGHTHSGTTSSAGSHSHGYDDSHVGGNGEGIASGIQYPRVTLNKTTDAAGAHTHSFTTSTTGGGGSHENRPPYYALAYIMKA